MRNALIALLALLAAILVWLALRGDDAAPAVVPAAPEPAATETPAQPATAAELPAAEPASPAARLEVEPVATPPASSLTVTLKGRCVDAATGAPLAGCEVEVHGWGANSERMDAYLKDHENVDWEDPAPQTTGPDGVFAITFVPPPPYQFTLDVRAAQCVRMSGRWGELEPGTVVDFGDIALVRGSRVSGIVADSDGVPQAGVEVHIRCRQRSREQGVGPRSWQQTRSKADGTFTFGEPVSAGAWEVRLRGRQKVAPESLEVPERQAFTALSIETVPLSDVETITGVVVDETGAPVRGVEVETGPSRGGGWSIYTQADGTFAVDRGQGDSQGPIRLLFSRNGYEELMPEERYPWGAADLRFTMVRGVSVEVAVVDGDTGEPIEDYGVRCFPAPGTRDRRTARDYEVRNRGHHEGGRTTVGGLRRGACVLVVEPTGDRWQTSDLIRFEVTDAGVPEQHVPLLRTVSRTLRVQRASGEPVAGSSVELLRPLGEQPVTIRTAVEEIESIWGLSGPADSAVVLMSGETDARGQLVLRGPPRGPLALRILGPGHQPWCNPAVTLLGDQPLVVTVPAGATVFGKIGPTEFLERVRSTDPRSAPSIVFEREVQGRREQVPGSAPFERVRLRDDGTFRATGLPPGTWNAHLEYWIAWGDGSSADRSVFLQTLAGLADGEARELNADLGHLLQGSLSGTVLMNGQPLLATTVQLRGRRPDGPRGEQRIYGPSITTGADATFAVQLEPATYRLFVRAPRTATGHDGTLSAMEEFSLAPSQELDLVFHVLTGALRLRVLRSDGRPVSGIEVLAGTPDRTWSAGAPPTDENGQTTLAAAPSGTVVLTAIPKRLLDPEAQQEFWKANRNVPDAWENALLQLGRAEIPAGESANEVEVRLPARSDY